MAAVMQVGTDEAVRDPQVEEWLNDLGFEWTFNPDFNIQRVDREASLQNQARSRPISNEVVERYAADMERGDKFPPLIIVRRADQEGLIAAGGNHRMKALDMINRETHPAYIVNANEEDDFLRMVYEDNRRHGVPPEDKQRIKQGIDLVERFGWSMPKAAHSVGVPLHTFRKAHALMQSERRAEELNIAGFKRIGETNRWRLGALSDDVVFETVAKKLLRKERGTDTVSDLVTAVNQMSRADALAEVDKVFSEEELPTRAHRAAKLSEPPTSFKPVSKVTSKFLGASPRKVDEAISMLLEVDPGELVKPMKPSARRELRVQLLKGAKHLIEIENCMKVADQRDRVNTSPGGLKSVS